MPLAKKTKKAMQAAERRRNESPEARYKRREANRLYMLNKRAIESQRCRKTKNQLQEIALALHKHESSQSRVLRPKHVTVYSANLRTCENSQSREKTLSSGLEYSSKLRNAELPIKMGKKKPHKYRPKKRNRSSKMQRLRRQREVLAKLKGKSSNESLLIPSDVSSQCVEHTTTSLGSSDAVVTTEKDNLTSALEQYINSDNALETNIEDRFIISSKESGNFQCKKEPSIENKSSHFQRPYITDALIARSEYASECFRKLHEGANIESRILKNSDDVSEINTEDKLIISSEESEIFQCKKELPVEDSKVGEKKPHKYHLIKWNYSSKMQRLRRQAEVLAKLKGKSSNESILIPSDVSSQCVEHTTTSLGSSDAVVTTEKDNLTSALEQYIKSSYLPELNIDDVLIVRSNESMLSDGENVESAVLLNSDDVSEINTDGRWIVSSKESETFQCKEELPVEDELGARSSAADKSFRPFTAIKQESPDPEFVSAPEKIAIAEFVSPPEESPVTKFASVPDYCQCLNPKCLESISHWKKKAAGLEFQLKESLRMSGEMYLRVQSVLEEKRMLESKLKIAEKENSCLKQRYNGCFVSR